MTDVKPFGLSVKAVVRDSEGRCLVVRRSKSSKFWPGMWELPGGKVDAGEAFDDALRREIREESGLDVQLLRYLGGIEWPLPHINVVFIVMEAVVSGGEFNLSGEHEEAKWLALEEFKRAELCEPFAKVIERCSNHL